MSRKRLVKGTADPPTHSGVRSSIRPSSINQGWALLVFRRRHMSAGSATHLSCKLLSQLWNRAGDKRRFGPSGCTSRCAAGASCSPGPSSRSACPGSPAKRAPPRRCSNWICGKESASALQHWQSSSRWLRIKSNEMARKSTALSL